MSFVQDRVPRSLLSSIRKIPRQKQSSHKIETQDDKGESYEF